jgi:hypothetical protein
LFRWEHLFTRLPSSLASSEHLLGLAPIATPTFLVTNDAIATYNVTVLLVTLVSALSTFQLARAWTSNAPAAFLRRRRLCVGHRSASGPGHASTPRPISFRSCCCSYGAPQPSRVGGRSHGWRS